MTEVRPYNDLETEAFSCPVLGGTAYVIKQYRVVTPGVKRLTKMDCHCKDRCGVGKETQQNTITYDWSICPKYQELMAQKQR